MADLQWKRATLGQCTHCGYDLRASPGCCPECGQPRPPSLMPAATSAVTPMVHEALARAKEIATSAGDDHICSEHLLLALLHEKDAVAAAALRKLGVTEEGLRDVIAELTKLNEPTAQAGAQRSD